MVQVVVADALHILRLLRHPAFPAPALPSIILVDINTGRDELHTGLSFPPPAFVTPSVLSDFSRALGGGEGMQLLAVNLGARAAGVAAGVVASVKEAFAGRGSVHVVRPSSLGNDGEEEVEEDEDEEDINTVLFAGPAADRVKCESLSAFAPQRRAATAGKKL
jgi:hypothetical protein